MLTRRVFNRQLLGLGAAALGFPVLASAQGGDYPSRPIRIIVPYAAGGGPDVLTRKMAVRMAEALGKGAVVIVDNIVGAGGILAAQNVARMAPDGYNILLGASSHLVQKAMQPSVTALRKSTSRLKVTTIPGGAVSAFSPTRNCSRAM